MRTWTVAALGLVLAACTAEVVPLGNGAEDGGGTGGAGGSTSTGGSGDNGGTGGGGTCLPGTADCDGDPANGCETDLVVDSRNCGACDEVCAPGQSCSMGLCSSSPDAGDAGDAPSCQPGFADCDADPNNGCETNLQYDSNNCGACGMFCQAGAWCSAGFCVVGPDAGDAGDAGDAPWCNPGHADCNDNMADGCETDLLYDSDNCGACGMVCQAGAWCSAGFCAVGPDAGDAGDAGDAPWCGSGYADCNGSTADGCEADLLYDSANCGSCGLVCQGGAWCSAGFCVTGTDAGDAGDSGAGVCDPFTNSGCQSGWACNVLIPYYTPADILCRPAGAVPADGACSPQALCSPGTGCVFDTPNGTGQCRKYCDLSGSPHICPANEHCASILHPAIGICVP